MGFPSTTASPSSLLRYSDSIVLFGRSSRRGIWICRSCLVPEHVLQPLWRKLSVPLRRLALRVATLPAQMSNILAQGCVSNLSEVGIALLAVDEPHRRFRRAVPRGVISFITSRLRIFLALRNIFLLFGCMFITVSKPPNESSDIPASSVSHRSTQSPGVHLHIPRVALVRREPRHQLSRLLLS